MTKNNLNILLTNMSKKFNDAEYNQATSTLYAILNSVTYGYNDPLSPQILNDARDIYSKCSLARALNCLLYTSPSPRDGLLSRMPSSA